MQLTPPSPMARYYFQLGRIILHVEHPADLDGQRLAKLIATSEVIEKLAQGKISPPQPEAILTFKSEARVFSLVPTDMSDKGASPKALVELLKGIYDYSEGKPIPISSDPEVILQSASPNWVVSGANHLPGTGGPGSWPEGAQPTTSNDWKFSFPNLNNGELAGLCGQTTSGHGVHVAILDTVPSQAAINAWRGQHPLIGGLLGPGGFLQVYPATMANFYPMTNHNLADHPYVMSDHGLFVAGIIYSLAPAAKLHLHEVLGPYGVGFIEAIAQALLQVLNDTTMRPLIVNCSFFINLPPDEEFDPNFLAYASVSFKEIFDWLAQDQNVVVVAAAGNEAQPGSAPRPDPRYPAAFDTVIGVGALPRASLAPAPYSNLCDTPQAAGYMTLGGKAGVGNGVLGVYTGEFPTCTSIAGIAAYTKNNTGWAWWAGTSFATAIISGILAAWRSSTLAILSAPTMIANAENFLSTQAAPVKTVDGERVLKVTQG